MYIYKAKVSKVIDGDTIDASIDLGFDVPVQKRIKLAGINTIQKKSRGLDAKNALVELLCTLNQNDYFVLESEKVEKFGRVIGRLHIEMENKEYCVNQKLIDDGHAVEYYGGKK